MSDINFCNTKEQLNHLGEVVTGKVDGSPTGADIDTSTLPYTGQVRKTLPALEGEYEQSIADKEAEADEVIDSYRLLNKGAYSSGITLESKFEYITYNGESYFALNPPYTTTATTPDSDGNLFVGGYLTSQQLSLYSDIVYKASGGNSAVENMVDGIPISVNVGETCQCENGTIFKRAGSATGGLDDYKPLSPVNVKDFGAVGDGNLSANTGTDNTEAIQAAIDYAATTGHNVYIPAGVYKIYSNLVWKNHDIPLGSRNKGQYLYGDDASESILLGDDGDMLDLNGVSIHMKDLQLSAYGASKAGAEFLGRCIYDTSRPGNVFVDVKDCIFARAAIGIDGSLGTYVNRYTRCKFQFCGIGIVAERSYASTVFQCNFDCKTAIYSRVTNLAVSVTQCEFAIGTYGQIFGVPEKTIDIHTEGFYMSDCYFENYGTIQPGSSLLNIGFNTTDTSEFKNNYFAYGSSVPSDYILRNIYSQPGYTSMDIKTIFQNNRLNGTPSVEGSWWHSDTTSEIRLKVDEKPKHSSITIPQDSIIHSVGNKFATFANAYTYTHGTTPEELDLNDWLVNSDSRIGDSRVVTTSGLLRTLSGTHRISVGARIAGVSGKSIRLRIRSEGGRVYNIEMESSDGTYSYGSTVIASSFGEVWTLSLIAEGYTSGETFQMYDGYITYDMERS